MRFGILLFLALMFWEMDAIRGHLKDIKEILKVGAEE